MTPYTDMRRQFPRLQVIGNPKIQTPWYTIGAFPASNRLLQVEIDDLHQRLDALIENLRQLRSGE